MNCMVKEKNGFSLFEVFISVLLLGLIMSGVANIFLATKRHIVHNRSKIQTAEFGRYLLAPLQKYVNQSEWNSTDNDYNSPSELRKTGVGSSRPGSSLMLNGIPYNSAYAVSVPPDLAETSPMRKVKVTISWQEPTVP